MFLVSSSLMAQVRVVLFEGNQSITLSNLSEDSLGYFYSLSEDLDKQTLDALSRIDSLNYPENINVDFLFLKPIGIVEFAYNKKMKKIYFDKSYSPLGHTLTFSVDDKKSKVFRKMLLDLFLNRGVTH